MLKKALERYQQLLTPHMRVPLDSIYVCSCTESKRHLIDAKEE